MPFINLFKDSKMLALLLVLAIVLIYLVKDSFSGITDYFNPNSPDKVKQELLVTKDNQRKLEEVIVQMKEEVVIEKDIEKISTRVEDSVVKKLESKSDLVKTIKEVTSKELEIPRVRTIECISPTKTTLLKLPIQTVETSRETRLVYINALNKAYKGISR